VQEVQEERLTLVAAPPYYPSACCFLLQYF
jgi:hypothetical protein